MSEVGSSPVRLRGVVAGADGAVPIATAALVVAGGEPIVIAAREPFDLVLDSGDRIRVELAEGDALRLLTPERDARGTWGDVERDPLARAFRDRAPGPHVGVKLRGRCVGVGDTVEVLAEVLTHDLVDGPVGPREAPALRIASVRAVAVAMGDHATDQMDAHCRMELAALRRATAAPRKPIDWKTPVIIAACVAVIGLVAIAMIASRVVVVDVVALVTAIGVVGYDAAEGETVPSFRVGAEAARGGDRVWLGVLSGLLLVGALLLTLAHVGGALIGSPPAPSFYVAGASAGAVLASALGLFTSTRYATRIVRLLMDAAPHPPGLPDGAWGLSVGRVADPTPLLTTSVPTAMALVTTEGSPSFAHVGTFVVESDAGRLEVDPSGALWASRVLAVKKTEDGKSVYEEMVPIGGSIAVAGRVRRAGSDALLSATGPESLILFATPAETPAIDALRRFLRGRRRMLVVLTGSAVAIVGFALLLLRS